jgi:hypothetical protein
MLIYHNDKFVDFPMTWDNFSLMQDMLPKTHMLGSEVQTPP